MRNVMELNGRKKEILKAIIESYIETAEPVGSKHIAQSMGTRVSSATVRNEMAELTRMGFLEQPHTSAGRIPSIQGYRFYVNDLMRWHKLTLAETREINRILKSRIEQLDALISDAGKIIAELTNYPAYAMAAHTSKAMIKRFDFIAVDTNTMITVVMLDNNTVKNKLMNIPSGIDETAVRKLSTVFNANFTGIAETEITSELISAAERAVNDGDGLIAAVANFAITALAAEEPGGTYLSGTAHIFDHPEYRDLDKAQKLLNYLTDRDELMKLPAPDSNGGIKITIGPENLAEELRDSSIVVASYDIGNDMKGILGVVGPTRMDYPKVVSRLDYISRGLKYLLMGGSIAELETSGERDSEFEIDSG